MTQQVTIQIIGNVQGVFFRAEAKSKAEGLGLTGWVKNEPDGSVLICAQGPEDKLREYVEWCKKGPDGAQVETADLHFTEDPLEAFGSFEITR